MPSDWKVKFEQTYEVNIQLCFREMRNVDSQVVQVPSVAHARVDAEKQKNISENSGEE